MPTYDRRQFLQRAGLAGAGAMLLSGIPRPAPAVDDDLAPFHHGIASGDPRADRVLLWTRVTPHRTAPINVRWTVARDPGLQQVVARGIATARPRNDWAVKVDATGLAPATWYFYAFEALGRWSPVGRTKTAPAPGSGEHLRFGLVSCSNYEGGFFNAYARLAERPDLDAILHVGDYVYEYGNGGYGDGPAMGRPHQPPHEMVTLADYRLRHATYKRDPDLRRLHQLFPFVTTWDDHESANNSRRDSAENHQPDEGSWEVRKAAAQRAYAEWMPIRTTDPARIYRTLPFGGLADLVVLDTRLEGRDDEAGQLGAMIVSGAEVDDPDRQLISPTQRQFLFDSLSGSSARWRILAQQVVLGQWAAGGLPRVEMPDTPAIKLREGGNALNPDAWDGYTAERDRLFGHVRSNGIGNLVVLTGDVHSSWALDLVEDPFDPRRYDPVSGAGALGVEVVTPAVTSASLGETFGAPTAPVIEAAFRAANPHVKYVDVMEHGYVVLDVTADRVQADWFFVDTVAEPSDGERLGTSWQVLDGEQHLRPASGPAPAGREAPSLDT